MLDLLSVCVKSTLVLASANTSVERLYKIFHFQNDKAVKIPVAECVFPDDHGSYDPTLLFTVGPTLNVEIGFDVNLVLPICHHLRLKFRGECSRMISILSSSFSS